MDSQENPIVENQLHRSLLSFNGDNFAKIIQILDLIVENTWEGFSFKNFGADLKFQKILNQ